MFDLKDLASAKNKVKAKRAQASGNAYEDALFLLDEFEKEPDSMDHFIKELDSSLKNLNSDYEAKRHKNIALRMPVLHLIKKGVFSEWLRSKGKLGGQHKVPRLSNERILLEEILKLNNGAAGKLAI